MNSRFCKALVLTAILGISAHAAFAQNIAAVSRDGHWIAYAYNHAVWLIATSENAKPEKIAKVSSIYMTSPLWSPTGDRLAYYSKHSGSLQLWLYDVSKRSAHQISFVDGGINPPSTASLNSFFGAALRYSWSPDGTKIVFSTQVVVSDHPGTADHSVPLSYPSSAQLAAGTPVVLTNETPKSWTLHGVVSYGRETAVYRDPHRSPTTLHPRCATQLFVLDVSTGKTRQITHGGAGYFMPEWSPDGKSVAYMSASGIRPDRDTPETDIFTLNLHTGRKTRITHGATEKSLPLWSPDGRWITYYGYDIKGTFARRTEGVYVVRADGGAQPRLLSIGVQRRIMTYAWSPDGAAVLITYRNGLETPLVRVDVRTARVSRVSPPGAALALDGAVFGASRGGVAWAQMQEPNGPTTLWFQGGAGQSRRLADIVPGVTPGHRRYAALHWKNSRGDKIDGLLVFPVHYSAHRRYPLVVDAYGNGSLTTVRNYGSTNYVKASQEYFVFRPNHRAPQMWLNGVKGPVYDAAAVGPTGIAVMTDDIMSGVDMLIRKGLVDPNRMCLVGFSNGGMEAEQLLTQVNRFKCAVLQSPSPGNWLYYAFLGYPADAIRFMYGIAPWQDPAIYAALTPLFHADRITTPILLAAGDREPAIIPTVEMYKVLRFLHKPVTLLRYTTEGHGFTGAAEKDFTARIAEFLDRYLGKGTAKK